MWRIGIECKMQQLWGVFYRCEEYAWLLHEIWLRAYFSHTWEILVWNPWRIGPSGNTAYLSHQQIKKMTCTQRSLRSALASAQSDQFSLSTIQFFVFFQSHRILRNPSYLATHWVHSEDWSDCADPCWSDSSLGAQSFCWFCHGLAQLW